jgi:hypothetical protein
MYGITWNASFIYTNPAYQGVMLLLYVQGSAALQSAHMACRTYLFFSFMD